MQYKYCVTVLVLEISVYKPQLSFTPQKVFENDFGVVNCQKCVVCWNQADLKLPKKEVVLELPGTGPVWCPWFISWWQASAHTLCNLCWLINITRKLRKEISDIWTDLAAILCTFLGLAGFGAIGSGGNATNYTHSSLSWDRGCCMKRKSHRHLLTCCGCSIITMWPASSIIASFDRWIVCTDNSTNVSQVYRDQVRLKNNNSDASYYNWLYHLL